MSKAHCNLSTPSENPVLEQAIEDLHYFKKKLDIAMGTVNEEIARARYENLREAIIAYQKEHNIPNGGKL